MFGSFGLIGTWQKVAGCVVGYLLQDIYLSLWVTLAGAAVTALAVIPPWPFYNKHPEQWFAPVAGVVSSTGMFVDGIWVDGIKTP